MWAEYVWNIAFVQSSVLGHKVASTVLLSGNFIEGDSAEDNDLRVKCVAMLPELDKIYCQRMGGPIQLPTRLFAALRLRIRGMTGEMA